MTRARWAVPVVLLLALDVYLCLFRMSDMLGNLEAQMVIVTPAFVISDLLHRRRDDRRHAELVGRAEAYAAELAAHRRDMAAVVRQVGEIHALHLHGTWPEDRHRGRGVQEVPDGDSSSAVA